MFTPPKPPQIETHLRHYRSLKGGAKNFKDQQHSNLIALIASYKTEGRGFGDATKIAIRQQIETEGVSCLLCQRIERDRQFSRLSSKQVAQAIATAAH